MNEHIASRDWHTRARVRVLEKTTSHTTEIPWRYRTFRPGEELEMLQWGRKDRPVDRNVWWTSFDVDGAHIISADAVEVVQILDEVLP
jgi:hypothetical protein